MIPVGFERYDTEDGNQYIFGKLIETLNNAEKEKILHYIEDVLFEPTPKQEKLRQDMIDALFRNSVLTGERFMDSTLEQFGELVV